MEKYLFNALLAIELENFFSIKNKIRLDFRAGNIHTAAAKMLADNIFLWILAIPLGILAGFVFHWPAFWIYIALKSDDIVKTIWCVGRLKSEKWIKKISTGK